MNIEIKNVTKKFGKKTVLNDLSFTARSGQCIGILGENGSGKSTLFGVLTGLIGGSGSFLCDGTDLMTNKKKRDETVGFVPQSPPLLNELSARDNLSLWYSRADIKRGLSDGELKMLGIDEYINVTVSKMSGGMKKRLAIGCCIANSPSVLLLDEPTSALDLICKEKIYNYLLSFKENGGTVIIATHDVYELRLCDEIYILKNGALSLYSGEKNTDDLIKRLKND